jgi:hypothetical protein
MKFHSLGRGKSDRRMEPFYIETRALRSLTLGQILDKAIAGHPDNEAISLCGPALAAGN